MKNEFNVTRAEAIEWWNKIPDFGTPDAFTGKHGLCVKYYKSRLYQSLTGREIEKIWKSELDSNNRHSIYNPLQLTYCEHGYKVNKPNQDSQLLVSYDNIKDLVDSLDSQDFYEVMQQYRQSPTTDQKKVCEAFENVKIWIREKLMSGEVKSVEPIGVPEWLTPEIRIKVKETWKSHKECDDRMRINAVKLVQSTAKEAGYDIGIKKSMELMEKFCNIYN